MLVLCGTTCSQIPATITDGYRKEKALARKSEADTRPSRATSRPVKSREDLMDLMGGSENLECSATSRDESRLATEQR